MADLSGLTPLTTSATALSNLILVSPQQTLGYQPQNDNDILGAQPPSFLFDYEGEQKVKIESDITDHFIEDNTAIQDQIALKPEIISTHGFIGELNNVPPRALQLLKTLADKLTTISAYTPSLSATALLAYNEAFLLYQTGTNAANAAISAWSSITGTNGENVIGSSGLSAGVFNPATGGVRNNQTKQQIAFQQFYGYWRARVLFTVQTPWAVFQNMAIQSLEAVQNEETRVITDFSVTFKMMRFANTTSALSGGTVMSDRAATQSSGLVDLGTQNLSVSVPQVFA